MQAGFGFELALDLVEHQLDRIAAALGGAVQSGEGDLGGKVQMAGQSLEGFSGAGLRQLGLQDIQLLAHLSQKVVLLGHQLSTSDCYSRRLRIGRTADQL